jgi:predicted transcriptional regulator
LKEEQIKIIKTMNEATGRIDLNTLAQIINLDKTQTIIQIQELAKQGALRKVGSGYCVTEKGKATLKAFTPISKETRFQFYNKIGHPTVYFAQSLEEFYKRIKQIGVDSIEFHLYRGDFDNWITDIFLDAELAEELGKIKSSSIRGENLRKAILQTIETKYGIEEL